LPAKALCPHPVIPVLAGRHGGEVDRAFLRHGAQGRLRPLGQGARTAVGQPHAFQQHGAPVRQDQCATLFHAQDAGMRDYHIARTIGNETFLGRRLSVQRQTYCRQNRPIGLKRDAHSTIGSKTLFAVKRCHPD